MCVPLQFRNAKISLQTERQRVHLRCELLSHGHNYVTNVRRERRRLRQHSRVGRRDERRNYDVRLANDFPPYYPNM